MAWKKKVPPRKPWQMIRREIVPYKADLTPYHAGDETGRVRANTHSNLTTSKPTLDLNDRQLALLNRWDQRPKPRPPVVRVKHSFYTIKDGAITIVRKEVREQ